MAADLGRVVILAADARIEDAARRWGADVLRVEAPVRNGSERIAAALRSGAIPPDDVIVNLQGDAVGASPAALVSAVEALRADPAAGLGTVAVAADSAGGRTTVRARGRRAIDFARGETWGEPVRRHLGIYAYRRESLLDRSAAAPGPRELALSLEQLRWIEAGRPVALAVLDGPASLADAVDTPGDLAGDPG